MIFFPLAILMISDESDREFMKALYIKYRMSMFRMARALTDSEQDAEDVVSEACVSLIKKISRIRQLDCNVLEGYIISIMKNAAYLLHRKKKARKEVANEEILQFVADEAAAPDRYILQECTIQELSEAIGQLPENTPTLPTWAEALIFRMGQRNAVAQAGAGMRRRLLLCGLRFKRERQTARYGRVYVHGPGLLKEKRQRE